MDNRPREERDLGELYPDIDDTCRLEVVLSHSQPAPRLRSAPFVQEQPSKGYVSNTVLRHKAEASEAQHRDKIHKKFQKFGFRPAKSAGRPPTYIRSPVPTKQHSVNYDMDEQDDLYLQWFNEKYPKVPISREVFEILISSLEYEWQRMEALMSTVAEPEQHDLTLEYNFDKYGSDDGTGGVESISEQRCAVCNDSECDNSNAIVFCDGCNIAVHQECYGIAFIPEGQWFCRRCMVNKGSNVECAFCPSKTGAFKQLDNGVWSHVVCALWINEVYFANPICLEPIEGVDAIPRNRWKLVCYICKQRAGACIQCSNRSCFQAYHVTCAKRAGVYMVMEKGVSGAIVSKATLKSYCHKHSGEPWASAAIHGIHKTRMFFRDSQLLSQKKDRLASRRKQHNRENNLKWRTENNTPIAPQMFVDILVGKLREVVVGEASHRHRRGAKEDTDNAWQDAGAAVCRYWCLKREQKCGAPLVKTFSGFTSMGSTDHASLARVAINTPCSETSPAQSISRNKLAFGRILEQDLERLIDMTLLTLRRQQLASTRDSELLKMAEVTYLPLQAVSRAMLVKMHTMFSDCCAVRKHIDDVLSHIDASTLLNAEAINGAVQQIFDAGMRGQRSFPATKDVSRARDFWVQVALPELVRVQENMHRSIPFTEIRGLDFELSPTSVKEILDDEDLSEVDELTAADRRILSGLLGTRT